jgi:hypothetical protein
LLIFVVVSGCKAIQSVVANFWIASSLALLAMTAG